MKYRVLASLRASTRGSILALCATAVVCAAPAATFDYSLSNIEFAVIDTTPDDGIAPGFTITSGSFADLLSPVEVHAIWGAEPAPPPSYGPASFYVQGTLLEGTALRWRATYDLAISVVDVDNGFDYDGVRFNLSAAGSPSAPSPLLFVEISDGLLGQGATYTRLTKSFHGVFDFLLVDDQARPVAPLQFGLSLQYDGFSFSIPRPVPEPSTYALLIGGLGLLGLGVRLRANRSH
jgi:hypothetical protein